MRARQKIPALVDALRVVRVPEATPAQVIALLEPYGQRLEPQVALAARRRAPARRAARRVSPRHRVPRQGARVRRLPRTRPARPRALARRAHRRRSAPGRAARRAARARARARHRGDRRRSCGSGVIGQDAACTVAARVIARLKAGLDDPQRPVGALLFAGPTGVGKTELAKQLARYLFGDAERLVRDRHERDHDPGAIARLITPSPAGTSLADRIRRQPLVRRACSTRSRKPTTAAFDLLLGVLGEGRLTDALGRLIDFRMSLIVMTTNLGAADPRPAGFSSDPDSAADHVVRDQELLPARAARPARFGRRVPPAAAGRARAHRRSRAREAARASRPRRAQPPRSSSRPQRAPGSLRSATIPSSARGRFAARSRTSSSRRSPNAWRKDHRGATRPYASRRTGSRRNPDLIPRRLVI